MSTNSATAFEQPLDPTDFMDYVCEFDKIIETSEQIVSGFTVEPTAESAALGFEISSVFPPTAIDGNTNVLMWVQVNAANREDDVFSDDGIQVAIEVTITTTESRRYQRTWLITVKQL